MTSPGTAREIARLAHVHGFDDCAIAEAAPIDPEDRLGAWLKRGYHADMAWMASHKDVRQDIRLRLPGARSVIVLAKNYRAERPPESPGSGRVSRYAWGRDYHRALDRPLRRFARDVRQLGQNVRTYSSLDTGPVLERAWAVRSGLGWLGKNSLLLREDFGSWFFIAVVACTLDLVPGEPLPGKCGECRRCIEACPTGAIVEPGVVDSRKCLSYHTIENRADIPERVQEPMGCRVFGCDTCQEVCPWNQDTPHTGLKDFEPRPGQANPLLDDLANIDDETFLRRFRGTPLMRAKAEGIRRNARIAQANTFDGEQ